MVVFLSIKMKYNKNLLKLIPSTLDGALWADQISLESLHKFRASAPYDFSAQYMQEPTPSTDSLFKERYFVFYNCPSEIPEPEHVAIFADTAQKTAEHNDYTVFQAWGRAMDNGTPKIYLLDQVRDKMTAPELYTNLISFYDKWKACRYRPNFANSIYIEDKSSGSSLIQQLNYARPDLIIKPVQRHINKYIRAQATINHFSQHKVVFKRDWFTEDLLDEFRKFTKDDRHKHDDQIDACEMAVDILLVQMSSIYDSNLI